MNSNRDVGPRPPAGESSRRLRVRAAVSRTTYAIVGDREAALAAGCDSYIEKPIDPDSFVTELRRFLQDRCEVRS